MREPYPGLRRACDCCPQDLSGQQNSVQCSEELRRSLCQERRELAVPPGDYLPSASLMGRGLKR